MFANPCTTGHTGLRTHKCRLSYLDVMAYLYQIVYLDVATNDGIAHHSTVHCRVGTYLHIILYDDCAYLWQLAIYAVFIGLKAKAVCSDHHTRMQDAILADTAVIVDTHTGIKNRIVTYHHIVANVCMRIDLHSFAQTHILAYVCKCTYIRISGYLNTFCYKTRLLHTLTARIECIGHNSHQLPHGSAGVVYQNDRPAGLAFSIREGDFAFYQAAGNQHHAGLSMLQIRQIFLLCNEGQVLRPSLLYRRHIAHLCISIAIQRSA